MYNLPITDLHQIQSLSYTCGLTTVAAIVTSENYTS